MKKDFLDLGARILEIGREAEAAAAGVIAETAKRTMEDARENAPVGEGIRREARLVDSFSYEAQGLQGAARVVNPHAAYVEFGTGVRGAQSVGAEVGGRYDADWPGMAAQPYMYPAAQRARERFLEDMAEAVRLALRGREDGADGESL